VLSQTAEYALRAIVTLAQDESGAATAQHIASQSQVPLDYLSKVMSALSRAGLVHAQRGRNGGFSLAVRAGKMTVLDVVNAVEPIRRIRSCPLRFRAHSKSMCPLHKKLDHALALVEDAFRSTSIASLCEPTALCEEKTHVAIASR
jgi:Rrf2 family protein